MGHRISCSTPGGRRWFELDFRLCFAVNHALFWSRRRTGFWFYLLVRRTGFCFYLLVRRSTPCGCICKNDLFLARLQVTTQTLGIVQSVREDSISPHHITWTQYILNEIQVDLYTSLKLVCQLPAIPSHMFNTQLNMISFINNLITLFFFFFLITETYIRLIYLIR